MRDEDCPEPPARGNLKSRHVPQLSWKGREDAGGKGDTIEMENETSGTGLTTTQTHVSSQGEPGERRGTKLRREKRKSGSQGRNSRASQMREKSAKPTIKCCWWSRIGA
jgi:hypothetical protein